MSRADDNTQPTFKVLQGVTNQLRTFSVIGSVLGAGFLTCMWLITHFATATDAHALNKRVTDLEQAEALTAARLIDLKDQVREIARTVGARVFP